MKKNYCNLQRRDCKLMCSKIKTCVMSQNQGLKVKMLTFEKNGNNFKVKMLLDNNISICQVH